MFLHQEPIPTWGVTWGASLRVSLAHASLARKHSHWHSLGESRPGVSCHLSLLCCQDHRITSVATLLSLCTRLRGL